MRVSAFKKPKAKKVFSYLIDGKMTMPMSPKGIDEELKMDG